jgi:hypothetical protein
MSPRAGLCKFTGAFNSLITTDSSYQHIRLIKKPVTMNGLLSELGPALGWHRSDQELLLLQSLIIRASKLLTQFFAVLLGS